MASPQLATAAELGLDPSSAGQTVRSRKERAELGQFLTPEPVADFMASLFETDFSSVELLDAGAGAGALTAAFVRRQCSSSSKPTHISVTAFELDPAVIRALEATLADCARLCEQHDIRFAATILNEDFIATAARAAGGDMFAGTLPRFNAAIVNPPYRKIRSESSARLLLRSAGIETSNLYTAFVALITRLLAKGGELVAITPRSFCNGPYFKPFRKDFLKTMSLRRLHVFGSRSAAFDGDDVLQENIILNAVKEARRPGHVTISSSSGKPGSPVLRREVTYQDVVSPDDPEQFIHLAVNDDHTRANAAMRRLKTSLADLGLTVSTGRVVDFRAVPFLRLAPAEGTVPLIYPCHFNGGFIRWPRAESRKPNAIVNEERTRELLVPPEVYVLVKRFTAKEERRRVVACIFDPDRVPGRRVGFENHLNYFHVQGRGMPMVLAKGLATFLNSTAVDNYFRQFSGHTQVNATDLRALPYPSKAALIALGHKIDDPGISQRELDPLVEEELY